MSHNESHYSMDILRFVRNLSLFGSGTRGQMSKMRNLPRIGNVAENHAVFTDRSNFEFPAETGSAIFGMGCFWGVEKLFWNLNPAVYSTQGMTHKL
jgi:peptide-methionine (S)-S-oxide reductase